MNASIIIPLHKPDPKILGKIDNSLKNQNFKGKIEIIKVDKGWGLAKSLNYGIKKAKYNIVVSLHQDCVPTSKNWLKKLVEPLEKRCVVLSVSKVELPKELWGEFDVVAKLLTLKELGIKTPAYDEKGCAYRKETLLKVGLFDDEVFKTAGEDYDMFIKLKKEGKIMYPEAKVRHWHNTNWEDRLKKERQYANGFGALVRKYGRKMPCWYVGFIKATPIIGGLFFIMRFSYRRVGINSIIWFPISFVLNMLFILGFWKGFLMKRQV